MGEVESNLTNTVNSLSDIYLDLMDIKVADPEADSREILETARKEGISDMRIAYNRTYEKRLTQKKIDKEVSKQLKEREEKEKVNVLSQSTPYAREVRKVIKRK